MISIIIPLYNVENYIGDCLESFEKQSYRNFELIIVNDGSTDNSAKIVKEFMKKCNIRVKLINQENSGVSAARNKGLIEATGEYISFVDSDDLVVTKYLEVMINHLQKFKGDLIICGMKSVSDDFSIKEINVDSESGNDVAIMQTEVALQKYLERKFVCGMGSFLIRRDILEKNNLRFSETFRYSEDQEMIWKMINHSRKVILVKSQLHLYRVRLHSAMSIVDDKRLDGFKLMINLEEYFKKTNPAFYTQFIKHGVARWVWATTWQAVIANHNFREFNNLAKKIQAKTYMKKLFSFPDNRVRLSSLLYFISPRLYYLLVKNIVGKRGKIRNMRSDV